MAPDYYPLTPSPLPYSAANFLCLTFFYILYIQITKYEGDKGEETRIGFLIQKGPSEADAMDWEEGCLLDDTIIKEEIEQGRSEFHQLDAANPV